MFEAAIWIGVALSGLALLGMVEWVRSRSIIRNNGEAIKAAMPIAALLLLGFIAGAVAALFLFLFFLADYWQYALIIGAGVFAFLFLRIRRNWSEFMPSLWDANPDATGLFPQISVIVLQAASAMVALFMMMPALTGAFLLYMLVSQVAGSVIANLLLAVVALCLAGYVYSRLRAPAPPNGEGPD